VWDLEDSDLEWCFVVVVYVVLLMLCCIASLDT
jgi:hypothetical protein